MLKQSLSLGRYQPPLQGQCRHKLGCHSTEHMLKPFIACCEMTSVRRSKEEAGLSGGFKPILLKLILALFPPHVFKHSKSKTDRGDHRKSWPRCTSQPSTCFHQQTQSCLFFKFTRRSLVSNTPRASFPPPHTVVTQILVKLPLQWPPAPQYLSFLLTTCRSRQTRNMLRVIRCFLSPALPHPTQIEVNHRRNGRLSPQDPDFTSNDRPTYAEP